MPRKPKSGLPTRQQILDFIASSGQPAGKREIGRAFGLSGHDKILLKALLKDMADEGLIDSSPGRDRRGQAGRDDRSRQARGSHPSSDRRDRSRGRARP